MIWRTQRRQHMLSQDTRAKSFLPFETGEDRLQTLLPVITPSLSRILEKSLSGELLTLEDGLSLAESCGEDMEALVLCADEVRRQDVGHVVTYVVNRNINFTNVCFVG